MHIFILGSPRTGSTLLYQVVAKCLQSHLYITNECENTREGLDYLFENCTKYNDYRKQITFKSKYGKTEHQYEPSEASLFFKHWFGGGHPSEIVSNNFLNDSKKFSFIFFHDNIEELGYYMLYKNAWNCFRIPALVKSGIPIFFIWIKRNILHAALSDLDSRYHQGDPKKIWNSASPKEYNKIKEKHYAAQVIEQQYYFNKKIHDDLKMYAKDKFIEIDYEFLCKNPIDFIKKLPFKIDVSSIPKSFERIHKYKYITERDFKIAAIELFRIYYK